MKILVTGAKGQLGKAIENCQKQFLDYQFIFTDKEELDIELDDFHGVQFIL